MERLWQICYEYPTDLEKLVMFRPNWIFNDPELKKIKLSTTKHELKEVVKSFKDGITWVYRLSEEFAPDWFLNDLELDPDIEIDFITTEKQLREAVKIVLSSISKVSIKVIPDQKIETLYNLLSVNLIEIVFVIFFLILINKSIT
jgi:hypothetical protein